MSCPDCKNPVNTGGRVSIDREAECCISIHSRAPVPRVSHGHGEVYRRLGVCPALTMIRRLFHALSIVILCFLTSCGTIRDYTLTKRSTIDKQIEAARVETTAKLNALNTQQIGLLQQTVVELNTRDQSASDYLFKGLIVAGSLKTPTRPEMVMGQSIQQTATHLPAASPAAQAKAFEDLKTELDEARISNDALKAQYEKELGQARAEGAAKAVTVKELGDKLEQVEHDRVVVLAAAKDTEAALSDARKVASDTEVARKTKEAEDAKHSEKIKMWLIGILLTAAAACGIGAAFIPIPSLKPKLILGAAICGGAAIAIPFIESWMVMVVIGVCLLGVAAWVLADYKRTHGDAVDTYRALNEVKTKAKATFDTVVAPILNEWHTDPATTQRIDATLKTVGDT